MEKNYIKHTLYLICLVVTFLLLLQIVPDKVINKLNAKKIDILSDIRRDSMDVLNVSQPLMLPPPPPPKQDIPCPSGMVCFEDYSANRDGLNNFFKALDLKSKKVIRIAFFGDSYIEGDIFCADLRSNLQNEYGGRGVGLVPLTSQVASFRKTVKHSFSGWNSKSIIDSKDFSEIGISGYSFRPDKNATVKYSGVKLPCLEYVEQASLLYYLPEGNVSVSYRINDEKEVKTVNLPTSSTVTKYDIIADSIGTVQFDFLSNSRNLCVYGVSLQNKAGVIVDNFSLRGSPGTTLKFLSENILKQTDSLLAYDLIILQYGLNVMSANRINYSSYRKGMQETVEYLKKCFPKSSILLLSIGDRSMHKDGGYVTMPGVPAMVACQQAICCETGIVFWNLFEAMGGSGSMVEMVRASPPKANKDYTHLNFEGGKYLGEILFKSIVFEKKRYDRLGKNRKRQKTKSYMSNTITENYAH
ncbi:MAG: hypothetical protein LBH60_09885 [Prevotellaceae bacterium]|jgi:hypothetical protein|nr:hypothetical protein [Prevotellaceae bacterium]